jgi:hypothetical protein
MYRGFLKLGEAAQLIAENLAKEMSLDPALALADARKQLIQALYDEAVYSEGFWWDTGEAANRPADVPHPLPPERSGIGRLAWSTEVIEGFKTQEKEHPNCSALDRGTVVWDKDTIELEDEFGERCLFHGIRVRYADLVRELNVTPVPTSSTVKGSGFVGRPSSKHLVEEELRRRAQEDRLCTSLAEQSRELSMWLKRTHPNEHQTTPKAIENSVRHLFRELKGSASQARSA